VCVGWRFLCVITVSATIRGSRIAKKLFERPNSPSAVIRFREDFLKKLADNCILVNIDSLVPRKRGDCFEKQAVFLYPSNRRDRCDIRKNQRDAKNRTPHHDFARQVHTTCVPDGHIPFIDVHAKGPRFRSGLAPGNLLLQTLHASVGAPPWRKRPHLAQPQL